MVWYYDVLSETEEAWGANSDLPRYAISTSEQTATSFKWSSDVIKDGGTDKQTRIFKLEY